ncbi:citryl-CoA lyase [Methylobacterium pseudosasicola]|uniref:citrate synthase (unknown stereospecificity) n=1 Tax=Methylobacterium pseudosasicola TaxID=582667 RepID=A0A1I4U263_9HYPH|nr:citryl-CoA lyase [Methylobacterium pseudosasicola]SFM83102.1 citrate synthase [Methylobacterium pseudosasicola]
MSDKDPAAILDTAKAWWSTAIIDMKPGSIRFSGFPIEQLIGAVSFPQMIWLMLRGSMPSAAEGALLEAALVSAVDHGPQAPSIAIGRMSVTCGLPLNGAMASAINVLDDVHGGAGEQCMDLYADIARRMDEGQALDAAVEAGLDAFIAARGKIISGFGHRFHPVDPRAPRLLALVDEARKQGVVNGRFADIGRGVEALLGRRKGRGIPMNIDGATAVIYAELGFAPPLGRGLFILSRSVGILAHAWEQTQQGGRIKGPMPRGISYTYTGPAPRDFPGSAAGEPTP